MKKINRIPYESPQVKYLAMDTDWQLLAASTGRAYDDVTQYDDDEDEWVWM